MQLDISVALKREQGAQPEHGSQSFDIVRGAKHSRLLLLCDHASNFIPPGYGTLGLDETELRRHIGYDIGAAEVALAMGRLLDATVILTRFSRLLIDPNRGLDDPTLIMQISDGAIISGNAGIDSAEIGKRVETFYKPYDAAIEAELDAMTGRGLVPLIMSVHSYTDVWRGVIRKWEAGVLWDKDPRLALPLLAQLRSRTDFEIGDNEPYSGRLRGNSIHRHGARRGLPNVLIEVRQDLIRERDGQEDWASLLAACISSIMTDPDHAERLSRVEYFGSHTDMHEGERHSL